MFLMHSRHEQIDNVLGDTVDILIGGGGSVGSGLARDAASCVDFASPSSTNMISQFGTSSRSSRLLHGGLRYLAQGRIGLVREARPRKR